MLELLEMETSKLMDYTHSHSNDQEVEVAFVREENYEQSWQVKFSIATTSKVTSQNL
jgi:hypothetical protein